LKFLLTIISVFISICCIAQHKIGIGASTNGLGLSYRHVVNEKIEVGGSLYYLRLKGNTQNVILENVVNSKYTANTQLLEGFVQWRPFNSSKFKGNQFKESFFVKTGLALRMNPEFNTNSTFWDKTLIGSFELTPDQVGFVNINVRTRSIQPMVALGYTLIDGKNIFMQIEAGTYFHGQPKVSMKSTGTLHLNDVNQAAIQNVASKYQFYPLLKLETGIKL
jgi:hypothetical protein